MSRVDRSHPPHSDDLAAHAEALTSGGVLRRLLDPAFGLMIWAGYFLIVYGGTAVGCALGTLSSSDAHASYRIWTTAFTAVAAAVVMAHAVRTYVRDQPSPDHRFLMWITIGHDAVAAAGILWMLFPVLLLPVCG